MKKLFIFSCLLVLALLSRANGQLWQNVGNAGFSAGAASYTSIAIDGSGTPFVVYRDEENGYKATVMKFNGANWVNVGSPGFSTEWASYTSIAIDGNNVPYVVYTDYGNNGNATVMKFNGSEWVNVGAAGFSADQASYTSIAIDGNNVPYVTYVDYGNGYKATVMKFNGTAWVNVGAPGFSAGDADYTSIAIDGSGIPYVAYRDGGIGYKATLMRFNSADWVNVGTPSFSAGEADYTSIAIDGSGTPYVVYQDRTKGNKATVRAFSLLPKVYTLPITGISSTASISGGEICYSETSITSCGVCWNTTGTPTTSDNHSEENGNFYTGEFSRTMTDLALGTKYYVRAYATNSAGTAYGNEISFTAQAATPDVSTLAITSITPNTAVSGGNIFDIKESNVTARGVCWNTTGAPTTSDAHSEENGNFSTGEFSRTITGLELGTKYYVRAYATNASGTGYGHEISFSTYNPENASKMSFQGLLTDAQGRLLNDGNYSITFKLYDALTGGTQVWTETQTVAVARGMVNVNLGAVNPLDTVKFNTSYWLGISVGNGSELSPRTAITGSAYPVGSIGK